MLLALTACSGPQTRADSAADVDAGHAARLDAAIAGAWRSPENRADSGSANSSMLTSTGWTTATDPTASAATWTRWST